MILTPAKATNSKRMNHSYLNRSPEINFMQRELRRGLEGLLVVNPDHVVQVSPENPVLLNQVVFAFIWIAVGIGAHHRGVRTLVFFRFRWNCLLSRVHFCNCANWLWSNVGWVGASTFVRKILLLITVRLIWKRDGTISDYRRGVKLYLNNNSYRVRRHIYT